MKTYRLTILLPDNKTEAFKVKQLNTITFDEAFGYEFNIYDFTLKDLQRLCNMMLGPDFFNRFLEICDTNLKYRQYYKSALPTLLFNLHEGEFKNISSPNVMIVSHVFDEDVNGYIELDHITPAHYNFEKTIALLDKELAEFLAGGRDGLTRD